MRNAICVALLVAAFTAGCAGVPSRSETLFKAGNYRLAARSLPSLAASGDPVAETDLAYLYQYGLEVPKDENHALELYKQAVAQGNALAMTGLGVLYVQGDTISHDYQQAITLFETAMKQGEPRGGANLGHMYYDGWGVPKDSEKWKSLTPNSSQELDFEISRFLATMRASVITRMYYFNKSFKEYTQPAIMGFTVVHGRAESIKLLRSSGSAIIDADATQAVGEAFFPPPPLGFLAPDDFKLEITQD